MYKRQSLGRSYVLRGPPGCGKTHTLGNVVTALVASGKRVLIVAKMKTALTVLVRKVHELTAEHGAEDAGGAPLRVLQAADFCKSDGGVRSATDGKNAIAGDARLGRLVDGQQAERFWQGGEEGDEESAVRVMLRDAVEAARYGERSRSQQSGDALRIALQNARCIPAPGSRRCAA